MRTRDLRGGGGGGGGGGSLFRIHQGRKNRHLVLGEGGRDTLGKKKKNTQQKKDGLVGEFIKRKNRNKEVGTLALSTGRMLVVIELWVFQQVKIRTRREARGTTEKKPAYDRDAQKTPRARQTRGNGHGHETGSGFFSASTQA